MKYHFNFVQKASLFLPLVLKVTISKNTISNLLPQKIHSQKKSLKTIFKKTEFQNCFLKNTFSKVFY